MCSALSRRESDNLTGMHCFIALRGANTSRTGENKKSLFILLMPMVAVGLFAWFYAHESDTQSIGFLRSDYVMSGSTIPGGSCR